MLRLLAEEEDLLLRAELSKRFREATAPGARGPPPMPGGGPSRNCSRPATPWSRRRTRKASERAARERARREREQAEARTKYLDELARRESATWREVEELIATKRPKDYDRAITLLVDLRDLAGRSGRAAEAEARARELRRRHGNKPSLLKRFDDKKLGT